MFSCLKGDIGRLALSNVFNNAVSFLTRFMIAAIVSAEAFGIYSVALNVMMTVFAFSELGLGISVVRYYNRFTEEDLKNQILQAGISIKLAVSGLLLILSYPLGLILSQILYSGYSITLELTIAIVCASALGLWSFARTALQARQDYRPYAAITFHYGLVRLIMVLIVYLFNLPNVIYYLLALYFISPLLLVVRFFHSFLRQINYRLAKITCGKINTLLSYGKWILVSRVLYPLCFSLPLFMLMRMQGPEVAGKYAIGLMFAAVISPLNDAIRAFVVPKVSGFPDHASARLYIRKGGRVFIPYCMVVFVLIAVCGGIYELILSNKYPDMLFVIVLLMFATSFSVFGGVINSVTHYLGMPYLDAWVNVGRVIFVALSSVFLIPFLGAVGAALSSSVSSVFGEVIVFFLVNRRLNQCCLEHVGEKR